MPNHGTKVAPKEAASATKAAISALSAAVNCVPSPIVFSSPAARSFLSDCWIACLLAFALLTLFAATPPIWYLITPPFLLLGLYKLNPNCSKPSGVVILLRAELPPVPEYCCWYLPMRLSFN